MTQTIATQAASLTFAALMTVGTLMGVSGVAAHQRVASEALAMQQGPLQVAAIQTVVVIGHRAQRA